MPRNDIKKCQKRARIARDQISSSPNLLKRTDRHVTPQKTLSLPRDSWAKMIPVHPLDSCCFGHNIRHSATDCEWRWRLSRRCPLHSLLSRAATFLSYFFANKCQKSLSRCQCLTLSPFLSPATIHLDIFLCFVCVPLQTWSLRCLHSVQSRLLSSQTTHPRQLITRPLIESLPQCQMRDGIKWTTIHLNNDSHSLPLTSPSARQSFFLPLCHLFNGNHSRENVICCIPLSVRLLSADETDCQTIDHEDRSEAAAGRRRHRRDRKSIVI